MRLARFCMLSLILSLSAAAACPAQPSGSDVIAAVKANFAGIRDYRADLTMSVRSPGMTIKNTCG